jgi:transcriptional regulator with PAS, ATPase and Fis domain
MTSSFGVTTHTEIPIPHENASVSAPLLVWVYPRVDLPPFPLSRKDHPTILLGRDPSCTIPLTGNEISRFHAIIQWPNADPRPLIVDQESRNGIRINGQAVKSALLEKGDVLRIGSWISVLTHASENFQEIAPNVWGGDTLQNALAPLRLAAPSDLPVILEGETGTGKEVIARAIHKWSGRTGSFIGVNCAALPETLAEGELFGYRKGAFTGAERNTCGYFRCAEGGTLLLDEVTDLPLPVQGKLLRVLEEREVQPLGEMRSVPIDVRIVVASQTSLMDAVKKGHFRADLLSRLDGLTLPLPALRWRKEDVPKLFSLFLRIFGVNPIPALEADLVERLCIHDWPFNVRELYQLAKQLLILHGRESSLSVRHLPARIGIGNRFIEKTTEIPPNPLTTESIPTLPMLLSALRASGGNVAHASAMLGITRQRAYRMMEAHAVDLDALRAEKNGLL